jgi:ADP-ribosylglycohydrolase
MVGPRSVSRPFLDLRTSSISNIHGCTARFLGISFSLTDDVTKMELAKHCHAALAGIAVGDALGKMTEGYWPSEITLHYGSRAENFSSPKQPRSSHTWTYAEVTDDTRFTLLVAESIISLGKVDESDMIRRILERPIKGWPDWDEFKAKAEAGEKDRRSGKAGLRDWINPGFRGWEGATFALALVMLYESARDAILAAVDEGGDADTIASMAGGIVAARNPDSLPEEWVEIIERESDLDFVPLAEKLAALRR